MPFGTIIGQLIGVVIGSLLAAVLLRTAAKWVQQLDVPYGQAYGTVLLPGLINTLLGLIVGYMVSSATGSMGTINIAALLMLPVGFLIVAGFIGARLAIPLGRACLIALVMAAIGLAIAAIVAIPIVLIVTFSR